MAAISIFNITNAVGNGTTTTYTGTITSGASPMISGTPIVVTGGTTAAFNGNFKINGGNLTTTITVASAANHVSEAESGASGTYDLEGFVGVPTSIGSYTLGIGEPGRFLQPTDMVLGNYIPGSLPGAGQQIIQF